MPKTETLRWGNDHSLVMLQKPDKAMATLKVVKPNGSQNIPISLPEHVTVAMVMEAWERQGSAWHELLCINSKPFLAVRVIWLPQGAIMWNVLHVNDVPCDTCGYVPLTKDMLKGTGFEAALSA